MEVSKTLKTLAKEIVDFKITLPDPIKGDKYMKRDYVQALVLYHLNMKYGSLTNVPMNIKFRLSFESPQLVGSYFDLNLNDQESIWIDDNKWLVEKINGIRGTLILTKAGTNCFSRDLNENSYGFEDYYQRLSYKESILPLEGNRCLDVEIILANQEIISDLRKLTYDVANNFQAVAALMTMPMEQFAALKEKHNKLFKLKLIDVYYYNTDIRKLSYSERERYFDKAIQELNSIGFQVSRPMICKDNNLKKAFHEGIIKEGGEGTIVVNTIMPCDLTGGRKKDQWVKIKKSVFPLMMEPDALTDTVDGWISQINMNPIYDMPDTIEVKAIVCGKETIIADCSAIPLSCRRKGLVEDQVVELEGLKLENGKIVAPVVKRIRFDKTKASCVQV
jgi:hypothetical protein